MRELPSGDPPRTQDEWEAESIAGCTTDVRGRQHILLRIPPCRAGPLARGALDARCCKPPPRCRASRAGPRPHATSHGPAVRHPNPLNTSSLTALSTRQQGANYQRARVFNFPSRRHNTCMLFNVSQKKNRCIFACEPRPKPEPSSSPLPGLSLTLRQARALKPSRALQTTTPP
ncbi:hypothetical protein BJV74DRAFT_182746 [Russula compacta]|nr:hypothetical protein BJV74DRAFT_182746 [Russula compacta]